MKRNQQHHRHDPYSKEVMLSLTLRVSLYCAEVAAVPSVESDSSLETTNSERYVAENTKIRTAIKEAIVSLNELNDFVFDAGRTMLTNMPSRHMIEEERFSEVACTLRALESVIAKKAELYLNLPTMSDEYLALRRNLATTRSRTAQNAMILKQMIHVPESYESSIDMKGLEALTSISTERLHLLMG
ncbi:hypothetical protein [Pseudomonas sp. NKUCC02_KPG]|uniref:hypothetical protein n=1 Tax=Pseudomonas sp. NKUCC02_KPG TaxID=2842124 RepID=UPI001C5BEEF7|nr:hypothetical protein [Pseudomonas sp. NKUCC02_KPG]MBW3503703.1 hypothetical protein [Pseudomonas sp. NKUCC02_KPG]